MATQDNKLGKAKDLGILNSSSFSRSDLIGSTDLDDLYCFSLSGRSSLDLSLSKIGKGADVDVEVYALKRPFDRVKRSIGDIEFRNLRGSQRNSNLRLVGALKGKQTQDLFENLEQGNYFLRVLQGRKGNKGNSRYRFVLTRGSDAPPVTPLASSPVGPLAQPVVDNVSTANPITQADTIAPTASLNTLIAPTKGSTTYEFTVSYRDNVGINSRSLNDNDIQIIEPDGSTRSAKFLWEIDGTDGSLQARYEIQAPGRTWDSTDNGSYRVVLQANGIADTADNVAAETELGNFQVNFASSSPEPLSANGSAAGISGTSISKNFTFNLAGKAELQDDGSVLFRNGIKELEATIFRGGDPNIRLTFSFADIKASEIKKNDFDALDSLFGFDFNENHLAASNDEVGRSFWNGEVEKDRRSGKIVKYGATGFKYEITLRNPTSVEMERDGSPIPFDSIKNEYIFPLADGQEQRISFNTDPMSFILFSPKPFGPENRVSFLDSLKNLALIPKALYSSGFRAIAIAPKFVQNKLVQTYYIGGGELEEIVGINPGVIVSTPSYWLDIDFEFPKYSLLNSR